LGKEGKKLSSTQVVIQELVTLSYCGEAGGTLRVHCILCGMQVHEQISSGVCSLLEFTLLYCAITPYYHSGTLNTSRIYYSTGWLKYFLTFHKILNLWWRSGRH